jgi:hypothetical protein
MKLRNRVSGLNHALALIKQERLGVTYDEALEQVIAENEKSEDNAVKAIIELDKAAGKEVAE